MDTRKQQARRLFRLAYDTSPRPRYPKTVPSALPPWWVDATLIGLSAVFGVLNIFS